MSEKEIMAYFQEGKDNKKGRAYQQLVFQPSGSKGRCLIDSGNLVGSAMEYDFFQTLGINMKPYHQQGQSAQGEPLRLWASQKILALHFMENQIHNLGKNLVS